MPLLDENIETSENEFGEHVAKALSKLGNEYGTSLPRGYQLAIRFSEAGIRIKAKVELRVSVADWMAAKNRDFTKLRSELLSEYKQWNDVARRALLDRSVCFEGSYSTSMCTLFRGYYDPQDNVGLDGNGNPSQQRAGRKNCSRPLGKPMPTDSIHSCQFWHSIIGCKANNRDCWTRYCDLEISCEQYPDEYWYSVPRRHQRAVVMAPKKHYSNRKLQDFLQHSEFIIDAFKVSRAITTMLEMDYLEAIEAILVNFGDWADTPHLHMKIALTATAAEVIDRGDFPVLLPLHGRGEPVQDESYRDWIGAVSVSSLDAIVHLQTGIKEAVKDVFKNLKNEKEIRDGLKDCFKEAFMELKNDSNM